MTRKELRNMILFVICVFAVAIWLGAHERSLPPEERLKFECAC